MCSDYALDLFSQESEVFELLKWPIAGLIAPDYYSVALVITSCPIQYPK